MCSELAILVYLLSGKTNDRFRGLDPNILARLFQGFKQLTREMTHLSKQN